MTAIDYIEDESLIPNDNVVVSLTHNGYIKRIVSDNYKTQNRGGIGVKGMTTNEEDYVEYILNLDSHDHLLIFTNKGKVYRIKGYLKSYPQRRIADHQYYQSQQVMNANSYYLQQRRD